MSTFLLGDVVTGMATSCTATLSVHQTLAPAQLSMWAKQSATLQWCASLISLFPLCLSCAGVLLALDTLPQFLSTNYPAYPQVAISAGISIQECQAVVKKSLIYRLASAVFQTSWQPLLP